VLAIETARAGGATGEATAVLRTLPPRARRRLPLRVRRPAVLLVALLAAGAIATGVLVAVSQQTERGTGTTRAAPQKGQEAISLKQDGAADYDPLGDPQSENPAEAGFVLDRNPNTTWDTELYSSGRLPKAGVGVYVDAEPGVVAKAMRVTTPEAGWSAEVYATNSKLSRRTITGPADDPALKRVAPARTITEQSQRIDLDTRGQSFRYYLLWITKLPPSAQAKVAEIYLFR